MTADLIERDAAKAREIVDRHYAFSAGKLADALALTAAITAALSEARAEERERSAKIAENWPEPSYLDAEEDGHHSYAANSIASAIRSSGRG